MNTYSAIRAVILLVSAALAVAACSDQRPELRLIEPRLEVDRRIAGDLVKVMNEKSSISITTVTAANMNEPSIEALLSGRADIALISNNQPYRPGISAVMPLYANILHILLKHSTPAGSDVEIFTSGSVFAGPPGSPSRMMLEEYAAERRINSANINFVDSFNGECPDVIAIFAPIIRDLPTRLENCGEASLYRLHSLGTPDDIGRGSRIDAATLLNPSLRAFIIPAGIYPLVSSEPVVTLAVDKMLVARPDIPATVIYDLISEIVRLRPALAAADHTTFHALRGDFQSSDSTFVLHPGAQDYIERNEPSVYERYSGVAEVLVSIFFMLFSGGFAAIRIYNIRRKNRIDRFYSAAIELRKSVCDTTPEAQRNAAISQVRELQTEAFQLLVDEKLAANESFRIFITLSNDIIDDLKDSSAPNW